MARQHGRLGWAALVLAGLGGGGCVHSHQFAQVPPLAVPPDGAVPRELAKVTLPEYVIEPPDVLRIEVVIRTPPGKDLPPDLPPAPTTDATGAKLPDPTKYERVSALVPQPIFGDYTVRPDGTVYLGLWGSVRVAGSSMSQAAQAIRETVLAELRRTRTEGQIAENLVVILDVSQYNSKYYYIFLDGGGFGEQVLKFPMTGSETVLDAMTNVGGLHSVASKRNIWIARRTPHPGQPEQILPVDWVGISQHGVTQTNYQVLPGDRLYVKAQRIVTVDTALARLLSPVERVFGVTLLGTSVVNGFRSNGTNTTGQ